jgi:hypothetical protein
MALGEGTVQVHDMVHPEIESFVFIVFDLFVLFPEVECLEEPFLLS